LAYRAENIVTKYMWPNKFEAHCEDITLSDEQCLAVWACSTKICYVPKQICGVRIFTYIIIPKYARHFTQKSYASQVSTFSCSVMQEIIS